MSDIYIGARGNPDAHIMFIGEAPGKDEVRYGKPFVGAAGGVLSEMLLKAGIDESECYFTNICNYQPPGNDLSAWVGKGQKKSHNLAGVPDERIQQGLERLDAEIARVDPNVIVPLGNWPLYFLYGQRFNSKGEVTGISDYRGYLLEARRLGKGRKIVPTFHPSYYLHGASSEAGLGLFDLRKALRESTYPDIRRRPRQYVIDPSGEDKELYRRRLLSEGPVLYLDIEFMGRGLICIGYAVSPDWAVTWSVRSGSREDIAFHKSIIESGKPLGAQNASYDCGQLEWHYEIDAFKHLEIDTMVAAYVLNIEHRKDLGFLGSLYTDMPAWWDVLDWEKIRDGRQSRDEVLPYNCGDNVVTAEVGPIQQKELASDPKMVEAFQFDMAKLKPLWRMSRRGVPADITQYTTLRKTVTENIKTTQDTINDLADGLGMDRHGVPFNTKSPLHVAELLAAWMEIELTKKTKAGNWVLDNKTLMEYSRRNPQWRTSIEAIIKNRESRDFESKFMGIVLGDDGRWRCYYDGTKTVTRRLSSKTFFPTGEGSNLQNVPAPNSSPTYGGPARACFTTDTVYIPDRGQVKLKFGYADLKGAEFLIVAELTQDPLMLKFAKMSIEGTGNVHKETAVFMFSDQGITSVDQVDKESSFYFLGKKMRHSGNYLIGWHELMERINAEAMETGIFIDAAMAKKMINRYIGLHPGLPIWWDETKVNAKRDGRIRNLFGYPRVINDKVDRCLPELVAYVPQSTVGDALNFGLLACDGDLELREYRFELLLNVHDAIGFQYDPLYEEAVLKRVRELMSIPIRIPKTGKDLIIPVEIQTGYAWHPLVDWHG
jgi:uracil-DNA glycosylase family 4